MGAQLIAEKHLDLQPGVSYTSPKCYGAESVPGGRQCKGGIVSGGGFSFRVIHFEEFILPDLPAINEAKGQLCRCSSNVFL